MHQVNLLIDKILEDLEISLTAPNVGLVAQYEDSVSRAKILIQHLVTSNDLQITAAITRNIHKKSNLAVSLNINSEYKY